MRIRLLGKRCHKERSLVCTCTSESRCAASGVAELDLAKQTNWNIRSLDVWVYKPRVSLI